MPAPPLNLAPEPPLAGQTVAFTGELLSLSRKQARELVRRLGGETVAASSPRATLLVAGAAGGDAARASAEARAARINEASPGRARVLSEDDLCGLAGLPPPSELRKRYYGSRDILAMYPALGEEHLRSLEHRQIVCPALRTHGDVFFTFADLPLFRQAASDLERGVPFGAVKRSLLARRRGQLSFDWLTRQPATIVPLPAAQPAVDPTEAEDLFRLAVSLDDGNPDTREGAARAYRQAITADPTLVPALVNLANLHYTSDQLVEAQALYERAASLAPDRFEVHFNLGNVHHDTGRFADAERCYREAVRLRPSYADAHFYLAVTLEKLGRSREAKPHWKAYLQLAPDGEHHEIARRFDE